MSMNEGKLYRWGCVKMLMAFFDVPLLPQHFIFSPESSIFLFDGALMPLSWECFFSMPPKFLTELSPLLWSSEILGYTIPERGQEACKKSKKRIRKSLSVRQSVLRRPAESRSRKLPASWALLIAESINGVRSWPNTAPKRFQVVAIRRLWRKRTVG